MSIASCVGSHPKSGSVGSQRPRWRQMQSDDCLDAKCAQDESQAIAAMDRLRLFVSCRPAVRTGRAGASTRCSTQGTRRAPARPPSDTEHRSGEVARRAICDGPMLGSATQRRRVGADPISFWGTFRCKRPNSTLAASSGFDQPLMIVLASSRILELGARSRKASDHPGLISCRPQRQRRKTHPHT